jgi:hypothetical protein
MRRFGGLRRRWLLNTVGVLLLLGMVCVLAVTASYAMYYYSNMRSDMQGNATATSEFFAEHLNQNYNAYYQSCISYAHSFEDKDKIELQFINKEGRVVATSYGHWTGDAPTTSDISDAITTRGPGVFLG